MIGKEISKIVTKVSDWFFELRSLYYMFSICAMLIVFTEFIFPAVDNLFSQILLVIGVGMASLSGIALATNHVLREKKVND